MNRSAVLDAVATLAREAGDAILNVYYFQDFEVTEKADSSPVTAADLAAHHLILDGLTRLTPDIPVLSEEGVIPHASERAKWSRYWLVDPLDGTREFIAKNGEFTVNMALISEGRPILGVVFAPALDLLYAAAEGAGSWREQFNERKPIAVRAWPEQPMLMLSRAHPEPDAASRLHRLAPYDTTAVGSSLKYCRIAEGSADAYPKFSRIHYWDTAAAQCVLEQAGGVALALSDFMPLRYPPDSDLRTPEFIAVGDPQRDWRSLLVA